MPKKKLKLEALEVDSFATKLSEQEQAHLNGGTTAVCVSIIQSVKVSIKIITKKLPTHDEMVCPVRTPTKYGDVSCPGGQAC